MTGSRPTLWHRLDHLMVRLRPHRALLSLAVDGVVVAICWNATYLFRIGFERWWSARPAYDTAVMLGVVVVYLGVFVAAGVPRGMWRFSGFGEVQRLGIACGRHDRDEAQPFRCRSGGVADRQDGLAALLAGLGCRKVFHGVAQRPGKPAGCWIGPTGQVIMALPGNPVSALTGLHAFVLPALAVASGLPQPKLRQLVPQSGIDGLQGMTQHLPVTIGIDGRAQAAATGNSGDFIGLLKSDGFITLPPRGAKCAAVPFTPWL